MSERSERELARALAQVERRLAAMERVNALNRSTVTVPLSDTASVDLAVPGGIFTGVEASADALTALDVAGRASRTYRQDTPPDPFTVGTIPEGAVWYDTDAENRPYRYEAGVWTPMPVGQSALDPDLVALITMRFPSLDARDAALPAPDEGMQSYVVQTGLNYQYSQGVWVPLLQYIKKLSNQSVNGTALVDDTDFVIPMVAGTYRVEPFLHVMGANSGGDIQIAWSYSGTVITGNRSARGMGIGETAGVHALGRWTGHYLTTAVSYGAERDDTVAINEDILLRVSTPGMLTMRWAQRQYDDYPTTVSAASRVYITKMA